MSAEVSQLSNGMTVATNTMPHLETVALGVWVGVGSRHEHTTEHGISHFLEHMSFKGTKTRSALQIAEEIEAVGGELNAATSLETTAYYARVLKGDEQMALSILADILLNSTFEAEELERERDVILQEIAATRDMPEDIVYELAQEAAYPDHALGRPILGTEDNIRGYSAGDLQRFLKQHYDPTKMIVAAAGAVSHGALVRHAEALFGGLTSSNVGEEQRALYQGGSRSDPKQFEQSHIVLAFEAPAYGDQDYLTAQVLSGLLGGGMSSRLFQEVREKRGLCYSIYSSAWGLKDTGVFAIHAATGSRMMESVIEVTCAECDEIAASGPSAGELQRAKAQLKAGILMGLEQPSARAEQMARHLLTFGRLISQQELRDRIDDVTSDDVMRLTGKLLATHPSVAIVGAGKRSAAMADLAAARASKSQGGTS